MLVNRILGVVALLGWAMSAQGQDKLSIDHTHVPPYVIYEETSQNKVSGFLAEIILEMLRRSQIPYRTKYYPPNRFHHMVARGEVDLAVAFINQLKPEFYLVSQQPVLTMAINVYWLDHKPAVNKLDDIRDGRLGIIQGYGYDGVLRKNNGGENLQIEPIRLHNAALKMLQKDRIDYLLDYDNIINFELRKSSLTRLNSATIKQVQLYVALNQRLKNAKVMMNKLELSIAEMKKENYEDLIMERYFTEAPKN